MNSHRHLVNFGFCCTLCFWLLTGMVAAQERTPPAQPNLTILNAGIESEEDGPVVPPDYAFLPGQYVYFAFQISGYRVKGDEYSGPRSMSLAYKIELLDSRDMPLVQAQTEDIAQDIGSEDKDWLPKRRFSALLPPLIGAGIYHVHLVVKDLLAKSEAAGDFPFTLGGRKVESAGTVAIQDFRFLRSDQDGPGLDVPAFRPGDTVWARFDMTGFKLGAGNSASLDYGVSVLRPDGKVLFAQQNAAQEKLNASFYPPQFVPGVLSVNTTPDLQRGEYSMVVTVRDEVGNTSTETRQRFRIE